MASGDIVGIIGAIGQPATLAATEDRRAGGSSPAESRPVFDFDDTTEEYLDLYCRLEGYDGGGLTISWDWSATSATANSVRWGSAIRAFPNDAEDHDAAHTYDYNEATSTAASLSGEPQRVSITFTDGADMDSLATGESFILRIRREPADANDTMAGDAELWPSTVVVKET